jgi:pyridoxamine 5'-phosphate oxidase family protein
VVACCSGPSRRHHIRYKFCHSVFLIVSRSFTAAEVAYLKAQPLMRFATASASGHPDVAPVVFEVEGDDIVTAGFDITHTVRFRNIEENPRATVVIDDLAAMDPWSPRGIKIIASVAIETAEGQPRFRISPEVIISWGINDTAPGIPKLERPSLR